MNAPYFPNKGPETMGFEERFRRHIAPLPEASRLALYEMVTAIHPDLVETRFQVEPLVVLAHQQGRDIAFPRPLPLIKHAHISCGYEEWLARKYSLPGFVDVEPGDIVFDCGAYVGGFALSAVKVAKAVHLFEPAPGNFLCVQKNFAGIENAFLNNLGLYNIDSEMLLNISASSVEHSFLTPDDGEAIRQEVVGVVRAKMYCKQHRIETLDFFKIEAEGVELEVFEGLEELNPRKFAIDVSPERDGESPAPEFLERLTSKGYECRQRGHVLFARR
jgi:FkbM family methyltransferase